MVETLKKAARAGGQEVRAAFGSELKQTFKKGFSFNFATEADYASEEAMIQIIRKELPKVNIRAEESGFLDNQSEYTVVIDPLDGTHNFFFGIPMFTSSIGLLQSNTIIAGAVYNPILDLLYWAQKNQGAYRNDKRLIIENNDDFKQAVISYCAGYDVSRRHVSEIISTVYQKEIARLMLNWSVAHDLCLMAQGGVGAVIAERISLYDFIAGQLIAREAGARLTALGDQPDITTTFIISNPGIHDKLVETLSRLLLPHLNE